MLLLPTRLVAWKHWYLAADITARCRTATTATTTTTTTTTTFTPTRYVGPISHLYGEVWWTALPEVPLPPDIVKRFDGKAIAIVGYEVDQVRKGAGPNGEDVSVPINMAYNHHHDAFIVGKGSRMEKVSYDPLDVTISPMARADPHFMNIPVEHTPSPRGLPTSAHLAAGNGGEYRKSYHGFASPVAYVVDSPVSYHVLPMQVGRCACACACE
jgi:hypothetical protein